MSGPYLNPNKNLKNYEIPMGMDFFKYANTQFQKTPCSSFADLANFKSGQIFDNKGITIKDVLFRCNNGFTVIFFNVYLLKVSTKIFTQVMT